MVINDHARATILHVAHIALQRIIHRCLGCTTSLAVIRRKACGLLNRTLRYLSTSGFNNHMRTGHTMCMQPYIIRTGLMEGNFLILTTVLTYQEREAFTTLYMERYTTARRNRFPFGLLAALALLSSLLCFFIQRGLTTNITGSLHFILHMSHLSRVFSQYKISQQL